jgi:hypothetical protein
MVLATGMLVGGGTYLWQRTQVSERQVALDRALAGVDSARGQASTLQGQIGDLQAQVEALHQSVGTLKTRLEEVSSGKQHVAALLNESERQLTRAEQQLVRAEERTTALLGTPLADGRYFGALIVVGTDQTPPRLVIDLEQWFSGPAADQAAMEDGELPPGEEHVPNDFYIRNESTQWRILPIDPATHVSMTTYPFGQVDAPLVITLGRFGKIFSEDKGYVAGFPYWITVRDGEVVAIEEQYIP